MNKLILIFYFFTGFFLSISLSKGFAITLDSKSNILKAAIFFIIFNLYMAITFLQTKKKSEAQKSDFYQAMLYNIPIHLPFLIFFTIPLYLSFDKPFIKQYFSFYLETQECNITNLFILFFLALIASFFITKRLNQFDILTFSIPTLSTLFLFFFVLFFFLISSWHYFIFKTHEDFGIFLQLFYTTTQGHGFFTTSISNYPQTTSIFADHNSPILLFLFPIIYLPFSPYIYIFLNIVTLVASVFPLWYIMKNDFSLIEKTYIAGAYILSPYLVLQNVNGYSMEMFAPLLILLSYLFLKQEKFKHFIITFILALMIKEDLAFTMILFTLPAFKMKRSKKWFIAIIALSIASIIISFFIVIPNFREGSAITKLTDGVASKETSISTFIIDKLSNPKLILEKILDSNNLAYLYILLIPALIVLPFFTLESVMLFPSLLLNLFIINWATNITSKHSLVIPGILFIALISSLKKLKSKFIKIPGLFPSLCFFLLLNIIAYVPVWWNKIDVNPRPYFKSELEAINMIPDNATVAAPVSMFSRLGYRVYLYPSMLPSGFAKFPEDCNYILIDTNFPAIDLDYKLELEKLTRSDSYFMQIFESIYSHDGIYLFRKKAI
jgi:uncharacterized membrane protein